MAQKTIGRGNFARILDAVGGVNYGERDGINVPTVGACSMPVIVIPIMKITIVIVTKKELRLKFGPSLEVGDHHGQRPKMNWERRYDVLGIS